MARAGKVEIPENTVTEITNDDVTGKISFQHVRGDTARILGTTTATAPTIADFDDGLVVRQLDGPPFGSTLADIFPGAGSVRLYAWSPGGCTFTVYHA